MAWPTEEEIEKQLNDMSVEKLERLVQNIHHIAKSLANKELKKLLAHKISKLDSRLNKQERKYRIGFGVKKSIVGQDSDSTSVKKWPSLSGE